MENTLQIVTLAVSHESRVVKPPRTHVKEEVGVV